MNYVRSEVLEPLAAQYVLGTLQGSARARFARLVIEQPEAQQALLRWERRLNVLGENLRPIQPTPELWEAISDRIDSKASVQGTASTSRQLRRWRVFGLAAMLAAMVLFATLFLPATPVPTHVAQITGPEAQALWMISADLERGTLRARALNVQAAQFDQAFELWMLPATGAPKSLGLLPVGIQTSEQSLPPGLASLLVAAQGLAVTIEPAGGSPTGAPTGPVVHQANLHEL